MVSDPQVKYESGFSLSITVLLCALFNLAYIMYNGLSNMVRKMIKKNKIQKYKKTLQSLKKEDIDKSSFLHKGLSKVGAMHEDWKRYVKI